MKSKETVSTAENRLNKYNTVIKDELRTEYDLKNLQVRKVGSERKYFGKSVAQLDPDVTQTFPDNAGTNKIP